MKIFLFMNTSSPSCTARVYIAWHSCFNELCAKHRSSSKSVSGPSVSGFICVFWLVFSAQNCQKLQVVEQVSLELTVCFLSCIFSPNCQKLQVLEQVSLELTVFAVLYFQPRIARSFRFWSKCLWNECVFWLVFSAQNCQKLQVLEQVSLELTVFSALYFQPRIARSFRFWSKCLWN